MRISDWSSDVCSSDLDGWADPLLRHIAVSKNWRHANAASQGFTVTSMIRGLVLLLWSMAVLAADAPDVKTTWRLLDYVAVDYRGAVADGAVKSTEEYAEMTDFAATIHRNIDALPAARQRVVEGKGVSVRVDLGVGRSI